MAAKETVRIVIDAKDRASREIRQADGALGKLGARAKSVGIALAAVGAATVVLGREFVRLARRGGEVVNVQRAFNNITGDGEVALGKLRKATMGLVTDYDLMVQMNRAVALGAVKTADEFAQLTRVALALGRAQGVDAAMAVDSLTLGIGRQSRLLLDNLGITVSIEEANKRYAESLGKTVGQLTEAEKKQAFFNEAMRQGDRILEGAGGIQETNADNIDRIATAFDNALDKAGEWVAESETIAAALDLVAGAASRVANAVGGMGDGSSLAERVEAATSGYRENVIPLPESLRALGIGTPEPGSAAAMRQARLNAPPVARPAPPTYDPFTGYFAGIWESGMQLANLPGMQMAGTPAGLPTDFGVSGGVVPWMDPVVLEEIESAGMDAEAALYAGVGAFQSLAMAAIQGGQDIEAVLIPAIANIAAAQVGGPLGAFIGAAGGVLGSLFAGGDDTRRPRVVVDSYGSRALQQMETAEGGRDIQLFINGELATAEQARALGYRLNRISRLRGESAIGE